MTLLACQRREALTGECGAKVEKRKNSESSGRFLLGIYAPWVLFFSVKQKDLAPYAPIIEQSCILYRRETTTIYING